MLKVYTHADEFFKDNKHLIIEHQLELNLMWMIANSGKNSDDGFYGAAAKNDTSCVLAVRTAPYPCIMAAFGDDLDKLMIEVYSDISKNTDINIINGRLSHISRFVKVNDREYEVLENLYLYKLTKVIPTSIVEGIMITSNDTDFDSYEWALGFYKDCNITEIPKKQEYNQRFIESGNMYYWVVNDEIVSMASNHRNTEIAKTIGSVYTPPELRGNGYARGLVSALCRHLLKSTDIVILYADAANPISNHIYTKIGFQHIGDMSKLKLK